MNAYRIPTPLEAAIIETERKIAEGKNFLRNPLAEELILKDGWAATHYAIDVLKGRWKELENQLSSIELDETKWTSENVLEYWQKLVKAPSERLEYLIKTRPELVDDVDSCKEVWKAHPEPGDFTEVKSAKAISGEVFKVPDLPFDEEPGNAYRQQEDRLHRFHERFTRDLEQEAIILRHPLYSLWYANGFLKQRWPELEECIEETFKKHRWRMGLKDTALTELSKYIIKTARQAIPSMERLISEDKDANSLHRRRKEALYPGSTYEAQQIRDEINQHDFWNGMKEKHAADLKLTQTEIAVTGWWKGRIKAFGSHGAGFVNGIIHGLKGIGMICAGVKTLSLDKIFTGLANAGEGVKDTLYNAWKILPTAVSCFTRKELKLLRRIKVFDETVASMKASAAEEQAEYLFGVLNSSIHTTVSDAFENNYADGKHFCTNDNMPGLTIEQGLIKYLADRLYDINPALKGLLSCKIYDFIDEYRHEKKTNLEGFRKYISSSLFSDDFEKAKQIITDKLKFSDEKESRKWLMDFSDAMEYAALTLEAASYQSRMAFERAARSEVLKIDGLISSSFRECEHAVKAMCSDNSNKFHHEESKHRSPVLISDLHEELRLMAILLKRELKNGDKASNFAQARLDEIKVIRDLLSEIEVSGEKTIKIGINMRAPEEFLLELSRFFTAEVRKSHLRAEIREIAFGDKRTTDLTTNKPIQPDF